MRHFYQKSEPNSPTILKSIINPQKLRKKKLIFQRNKKV